MSSGLLKRKRAAEHGAKNAIHVSKSMYDFWLCGLVFNA
jgi:hypothetical protein